MGKSASGKDKIYSRLAGNKELNLKKLILKGAEGLQIAFLHPKSTLGVLTELCEKP